MPEIDCAQANLDNEEIKQVETKGLESISRASTPTNAQSINSANYGLLCFKDPNKNVVKWQDGEATHLQLYFDSKRPHETLRCNFVLDILKKALLWNESVFNKTYFPNEINFMATYTEQYCLVGANYEVNYLPFNFLTADPSNCDEETLYRIIDMVARSIFVHNLDFKDYNDLDFIGLIKHYLFMVDELGPVFEIYYAKKFRESLSTNYLSWEQKYLNLALNLETLRGRDKLIAAMNWHISKNPTQYDSASVINSFIEYNKFDYSPEALNLLESYDVEADIPTLILSADLEQQVYIINPRFLNSAKSSIPTKHNPLLIGFQLYDKNYKPLTPSMHQVCLKDECSYSVTLNTNEVDKPYLVLNMKNLLAHIIENERIDANKLAALESESYITKYFAWQSIQRFALTKMLLNLQRNEEIRVPEIFLRLYEKILTSRMHLGVKAVLLKLPLQVADVKHFNLPYTVGAIKKVLLTLNEVVAHKFLNNFKTLHDLHATRHDQNLDFSSDVNSKRALQNVCFTMMLCAKDLGTIEISKNLILSMQNNVHFSNMENIVNIFRTLQITGYPTDVLASDVLNNFFEIYVKNLSGCDAADILFKLYALGELSNIAKNLKQMRELKYSDGSLFFDIENTQDVIFFSEKLLFSITPAKSDTAEYLFWGSYIIELEDKGCVDLADKLAKQLRPTSSVLLNFSKRYPKEKPCRKYSMAEINHESKKKHKKENKLC